MYKKDLRNQSRSNNLQQNSNTNNNKMMTETMNSNNHLSQRYV